MAIINNNVSNVKFLRNGQLYASREEARQALETNKALGSDGTALLARYSGETATDVKTVVGFIWSNGTSHTVTIIDIEGGSADIQDLRDEINAKLGTGVSSANTVTSQLTALSGNSSSTSAETSVAGAKKYADGLKESMDYNGITTGEGVYVANVMQADGIISATAATLPTVAEVHEAGKAIIAVAEDKGTISASAGTIDAQYVDVTGFTATDVQGALEEVKANIGEAISGLDVSDTAVAGEYVSQVSETDGKISVTREALPSSADTAQAKKVVIAVAEDKGQIAVSRGSITSSGKTIVLTDNSDGGVNFEANVDGTTIIIDEGTGVMSVASSALVQYEGDDDTIQISAVSDGVRTVSSPLTIQKVTTGLSAEVKEEYHLVGNSGNTIGDPVKIYKDSSIVSIEYQDDPEQAHYQNLIYTYVDASGVTQTAYVDISELVLEAEFASGITVVDHVARGVVDPTSESFLTVGADGFKLSGVQTAINTAISGLDVTSDAAVAGQYVAAIEETDGIVAVKNRANVSEAVLNNYSKGSDSGAVASTDTINQAISKLENQIGGNLAALDATVSGETSDGKVNVKVTETDGVITAVDVVGTDIASDSALTAEITARKAVDGQNGDTYAANSSSPYISGASSLNDADVKLAAALKTLSDDSINEVQVNGVALDETDNAVNVQISGNTSAATPSSTEAIVVNTDSTTGAITIGLGTIDCGTY
jgi:hypothetical protein